MEGGSFMKQGWKGESRRHSLARKGIKTTQPMLVAKGNPDNEIDYETYNPMVNVYCPICAWGTKTDFDDAHDQLCDHMVQHGHLQKTRDYLVEKGIISWRDAKTHPKDKVWEDVDDCIAGENMELAE